MTNLSLLARIARGERAFGVPPLASEQEQAAFDALVRDVKRLAVAGYTGDLRTERADDGAGLHWRAVNVLEPGITAAGVDALRRAGREVPGVAHDQELR